MFGLISLAVMGRTNTLSIQIRIWRLERVAVRMFSHVDNLVSIRHVSQWLHCVKDIPGVPVP